MRWAPSLEVNLCHHQSPVDLATKQLQEVADVEVSSNSSKEINHMQLELVKQLQSLGTNLLLLALCLSASTHQLNPFRSSWHKR